MPAASFIELLRNPMFFYLRKIIHDCNFVCCIRALMYVDL